MYLAKKKSTGHWKPAQWKCQYCQSKNDQNDPLVLPTIVIEDDSNEYRKRINKPSGKHRKSNAIICDHPDLEFLESQINTLKSIVAKREAELKKIQESDNLKAKKIMNLESQLNEARKFACEANARIPETQNKGNINDNLAENQKIINLENKTDNLENQMTLLLLKFENIQPSQSKDVPDISTETHKIFSCDICDSEFETKMILKSHKQELHGIDYKCTICSFTTKDTITLEEHKKIHSQHLTCTICNCRTETEKSLLDHKETQHLKCIDVHITPFHKDMRRHKIAMHNQTKPCDLCSYKAVHDVDLQRHKQVMHNKDITFPCNICEYVTTCKEELDFHFAAKHKQKQRTRIFSARSRSTARRHSTSTLNTGRQNKPEKEQEEMFRPWSSSEQPSSSTSGTPSPFPRPFTNRSTTIPDGFLNTQQNSNQD